MDITSMHKNNLFLTLTVIASVLTLLFGIYEYRREHEFRCDILHAKLQLNNYKVMSTEKGADIDGDSLIRVTIIDTQGKVLYDSKEKDVQQMSNHLQRKEVADAIKTGAGYDIKRSSVTDGRTYFYSATYFPEERRIVRSAVLYSAPLTASLERDYTFIYYTVGILILISFVLYLRYRLSHSEAEKQRIKRQLTENAAHELKTPAATIEGYLETLVNNPQLREDKKMEFLDKCYAQSRRMSQLLADMSTLTRLDEASISRPLTQIDAAHILRQIADETSHLFTEQGIILNMNIPEEIKMHGDSTLIYSLFRNVIDNVLAHAVDATRLNVKAEVSSGMLIVTFADNGVGVSPKHLARIFERFYRVDKGRSRRLGGTGLGLAIVKNIALQYGGHVTATQTPGGGLTIEIALTL